MERVRIPAAVPSLLDESRGINRFAPAPALNRFTSAAASIGFLWSTARNRRRMRRIVGEAEQFNPKGGGWQRARQERQIIDWFGAVPDFIVTFDAEYRAECSDVAFLALLEHELYHCGQAVDAFGLPRFSKQSGQPIFAMRGHDIEEFAGVVRRYGIEAAGADAKDFVAAALDVPEIAPARVRALCGNCVSV